MLKNRRGTRSHRAQQNQNAITLIALVITIIVLLILVGISLNLIVGENGITERAVNSGKIHNISSAKEKVELEAANLASEYYQSKYINGNLGAEDTVKKYIVEHLPNTIDDYTLEKDTSTGDITLTANDGVDRTSAEGNVTDEGKIVWGGTTTASAVSVAVTVDTEDSSKGTVDTSVNGTYQGGSKILLTATPASGYKLDGWYIGTTKQTLDSEGKYTVPSSGTSVALVARFVEYVDLSNVTDDITYEPSGTYFWDATYATSYATDSANFENANKELATGTAVTTGKTDLSITKWKILKTNGDTVYLVPSSSASYIASSLTLQGAQGYNNAVNLLDEACLALYGTASKGITAESIDMDLIEGLLQEIANEDSSNTVWATAKANFSNSNSTYSHLDDNNQVETAYSTEKSKYPVIYSQEVSGLGLSGKPVSKIERSAGTSGESYIGAITNVTTGIKPYQTCYYMSFDDFSTALGKYSRLILPKSGGSSYWVASRCIGAGSERCDFNVFNVHSGALTSTPRYPMFSSYRGENPFTRGLFPVVSLSSSLIKKDGSGNYYVDIN